MQATITPTTNTKPAAIRNNPTPSANITNGKSIIPSAAPKPIASPSIITPPLIYTLTQRNEHPCRNIQQCYNQTFLLFDTLSALLFLLLCQGNIYQNFLCSLQNFYACKIKLLSTDYPLLQQSYVYNQSISLILLSLCSPLCWGWVYSSVLLFHSKYSIARMASSRSSVLTFQG